MTALRESVGAAFGKKTTGQTLVAVETVDSFQGKVYLFTFHFLFVSLLVTAALYYIFFY